MERLSDTAIEIINELHTERLDYSSEYIPLIDAASRLSAYEDLMERWKLRSIEEADRIFQRVNALGGTDLMAQYRDIGSIAHLRDLLQAEQDGRLVVLPCKVGATVYGHSKDEVFEYEAAVISLSAYNWYLRCQNHNSDFWVTDADIGKTVFLTREEAEAALKGGDG